MTVKELMQILNGLPEDTIVAHEKFLLGKYQSIELNSIKYDFNQKLLTLIE